MLVTRHLSLVTAFMEPEIDRRCPDCGAAVRPQAAFCPQCGRTMKAAADGAGATPLTPEGREKPKAQRTEKDVDNSNSRVVVAAPPAKTNEPPAASVAPSNAESISIPAQIARDQIASGKPLKPGPEPVARKRGQRVAAAARGAVEERLAPRVEKLRQASNVVWGEAQDDPNLRFILIAVFLFIIAIVIIVLGTYIR